MPQQNKNKKILFLDRDGVINVEAEGYITDWSEFEFLPDALETIKRATIEGYSIIIISNQSAIGRGLCSRETVGGVARSSHSARTRGLDDARACAWQGTLECSPRVPR